MVMTLNKMKCELLVRRDVKVKKKECQTIFRTREKRRNEREDQLIECQFSSFFRFHHRLIFFTMTRFQANTCQLMMNSTVSIHQYSADHRLFSNRDQIFENDEPILTFVNLFHGKDTCSRCPYAYSTFE